MYEPSGSTLNEQRFVIQQFVVSNDPCSEHQRMLHSFVAINILLLVANFSLHLQSQVEERWACSKTEA